MLRSYIIGCLRHDRTAALTLAVLSFVSALLLGLVVGVSSLVVSDYLQRMELLGQEPDITGSTVAFSIVVATSALAIVLMLKSAFDVSMHARVQHLGLLKTAGATDSQVRRLLLAEGCVPAIPAACLGVLVGIAAALVLVDAVLALTAGARTYEPVIRLTAAPFAVGLGAAVVTVVLSALLPVRRVGRMGVIEAIACGDADYAPVRRSRFHLRGIEHMLGVEGRLAVQSLRARRKSMRTANASITLAILAFVTLVTFETLSQLSTQATYFDRYEGVWDVRVSVEGMAEAGADEAFVDELRAMDGVADVTLGDPYKAGDGVLYYNILADGADDAARISRALAARFAGDGTVSVLNLDEEAERDARARAGLLLFVDVFAGVLACIGISDVFSCVLGRIPVRRREVAQLLSAGISRKQVRKMFAVESALIVIRPLGYAALLNVAVVVLAVQASPVSMGAFLTHAPLVPIAVFVCVCWVFVRLAYRLGERAVLRGLARSPEGFARL